MVENFELKPNGLVITWKKPFGVPNGFFFYSCGALRRIRLSTHTKYSHPCGVRYFVEMPEIESGSNERRTAHLRSVVRFVRRMADLGAVRKKRTRSHYSRALSLCGCGKATAPVQLDVMTPCFPRSSIAGEATC